MNDLLAQEITTKYQRKHYQYFDEERRREQLGVDNYTFHSDECIKY